MSIILIKLYRLFSIIFGWFAKLYLEKRLRNNKEDAKRIRERRGYASLMRPNGYLIWVHGASVGEVKASLPIIEKLGQQGYKVLLTSGTINSAKIAKKGLPSNAAHQYIPLDVPKYVNRFLNHWQPNIAIFIESEIWPNYLLECNKRDIPTALVNARMSTKSFKNWQKSFGAIKKLFNTFQLIVAQTEMDAHHIGQLGANRIIVSGNIKYDAPKLSYDINELSKMRSLFNSKRIIVAASTHEGEEEIILNAFKYLNSTYDNLALIIVPRHPERGHSIKDICTKQGFNPILRSEIIAKDIANNDKNSNNKLNSIKNDDIYIADTIGELGLFYRLSELVIMGGSFIEHGGQNPIEAAKLGKPVVHGYYVDNFRDVYSSLEGHGAICVTHPKELSIRLEPYMKNPNFAITEGEKICNRVKIFEGAIDKTLQALRPLLVSSNLEKLNNNSSNTQQNSINKHEPLQRNKIVNQ